MPEEPPRLHDTAVLKDAESILDWLRRPDVEETTLGSLAQGERGPKTKDKRNVTR